jgi:hypothetical protein
VNSYTPGLDFFSMGLGNYTRIVLIHAKQYSLLPIMLAPNDINHFYLLSRDLLWYKISDPAMRVMPHSGFEPTLSNRAPILTR